MDKNVLKEVKELAARVAELSDEHTRLFNQVVENEKEQLAKIATNIKKINDLLDETKVITPEVAEAITGFGRIIDNATTELETRDLTELEDAAYRFYNLLLDVQDLSEEE